MRAGKRRCSMCGQPRPAQGVLEAQGVASSGAASDGGAKREESNLAAAESRVRGSGGGVGSPAGPSSACNGDGGSSAASASAVADTGVAAAAAGGGWQCPSCGNEYGAARLKCRGCNTPRPAAGGGGAPSAAGARPEAPGPDRDNNPELPTTAIAKGAAGGRPASPTRGRCETPRPKTPAAGGVEVESVASTVKVRSASSSLSGSSTPIVYRTAGGGGGASAATNVRDLCAGLGGGAASPGRPGAAADSGRSSGPAAAVAHVGATRVDGRAGLGVAWQRSDVSDASRHGGGAGGDDARLSSLSEPAAAAAAACKEEGVDEGRIASSRNEAFIQEEEEEEEEDSFGDLFPALHEFEADESADIGNDRGADGRVAGGTATAAVEPAAQSVPSSGCLWLPPPPSLVARPSFLAGSCAARVHLGRTAASAAAAAAPAVWGSSSSPGEEIGRRPTEGKSVAAAAEAVEAPPSPGCAITDARKSSTGPGRAGQEEEEEEATLGVSPSGSGGGHRSDVGGDTELEDGGNGGGGGGGGGGESDDGESDDGDDVACGVCGCSTSKEDDPIVLCDGPGNCKTAVHADCYGIAEVPEGPWLCDPCRSSRETAAGTAFGSEPGPQPSSSWAAAAAAADPEDQRPLSSPRSISCALCKQPGGAMKLSRCSRWVHVACVWWTPELATEPGTVRPGPLAGLDPARSRLACSACHGRGGAAVECAEPSCPEAYHPFCAMRAGLLLREADGSFELFCRTHSRRKSRRRRDSQHGGAVTDRGESAERTPGGGCVEEGAILAAAAAAAAVAAAKTTPVAAERRGKGGEGSRRGVSTPPTCAATPPGSCSPAPACFGGIVAAAAAAAGRGGRALSASSPQGSESSPSPMPARRRPPGCKVGEVKKKTIALSDDDTDDSCGSGGGVSPGVPVAVAATTPGRRGSGGGGGGGNRTPLRVFDMAPPAKLPQPSSAGGGGEEEESSATTQSPVMRRNKKSRRLKGGGGGGSPAIRRKRCEEEGEEEDGLMTLSQAVSPVEEKGGRHDMKRRRLNRMAQLENEGKGGMRADAGDVKERSPFGTRAGEEDSGRKSRKRQRGGGDGDRTGKGKGKRGCDFDRASYRRYIDTEAEVDEDVSDDDEAELENDYDSEDSFVNDGPLSYVTDSSQEEEADEEEEEDRRGGGRDDGGERHGKKKKRGRKGPKFDTNEDETGMYRQLLQQSQPPPPSPSRRGAAADGWGQRRRTERSGWHVTGGEDEGGGGGGGSSRASSRFAFVNAVMAHAREGGDPLDIEEACGSDAAGGFTQEGYAGTPESTATTTTPGSRKGGGAGCPDWSPCDGMSSGGSASDGQGGAALQRYARVVVVVEGLGEDVGGSGGGGDGGGGTREAVGKVEALRGASVVACQGWRDAADKVEGLVRREESDGLGLPKVVTGPSLTPAQTKFLSALLRAPTLSYPGGLLMLEAFRGRSGKEVVASSARELQASVPGMTAQQAAKLKRFLMSVAFRGRG
ncbi:unnamed protein product [Ectocarpus sp. 12 AP-2014]